MNLAKIAKDANMRGAISTLPNCEERMNPVSTKPKQQPKTLTVTALADIEFKETNWLWYPYIPAGALTLLFGNGGMGKSWITCSIAADLSQGRPLPGVSAALPPQKILMVSAEDDPGRIIRPRMEALNANMHNIFVSEESFILDERGIASLEEAMIRFSATIVFLDPLVSYLGGKLDMNKSNESRSMMGPLGEAAKRTGTAVVVVHHERKDNKGKAQHRAMGSADFTNSVRSALLVDETKAGTRFMAHVKHNWSRKGAALAYSLQNDVFQWDGVFDASDDDAVGQVVIQPNRNKARDWLIEFLQSGPKPAAQVIEAALAANIPERTLNRAKMGLARSRKTPEGWMWELDGAVAQEATKGPSPSELVNPTLRQESPKPAPKPDIDAILARIRSQQAKP